MGDQDSSVVQTARLHAEAPQEPAAKPSRSRLDTVVPLVVVLSTGVGARGATKASEGDRIRFLAAWHLRQVLMRLALLVS